MDGFESDFPHVFSRYTYTDTDVEHRAQESMARTRDRMERELFYGKPKPCPYEGDASFGVF